MQIIFGVEGLSKEVLVAIEFPFLKKVGCEYVLQLPWGEEFAVFRSDFDSQLGCGRICIRRASDLRAAFERLCKSVGRAGHGCVKVKRAGSGSSEKSMKVRCAAFLEPNERPAVVTEHTITVPVSSVVVREGDMYLPRWIAKKTIRKRILKNRGWPSVLGEAIWSDADRVWEEIFAPRFLLLEAHERSREESNRVFASAHDANVPSRKAVEDEEEKEQQRLRSEALERKREQKRLARRAKLETISGVTVEQDWWFWKGGRFGRYVKLTSRFEHATLQFSGKRVYIIADGEERISTRKNVRIVESPDGEPAATGQ